MKTTAVMVLVSALLGTMVTSCVDEETPADNFNPELMAGTWYIVGVATWKPIPVIPMVENVTTVIWPVTLTAQTTFDIICAGPGVANNFSSCMIKRSVVMKTDTPGRFTLMYGDVMEYDIVVIVEEVVHNSFAILHFATHDTTYTTHNFAFDYLFSRTPFLNSDMKKFFVDHAMEHGVSREDVAFLHYKGAC